MLPKLFVHYWSFIAVFSSLVFDGIATTRGAKMDHLQILDSLFKQGYDRRATPTNHLNNATTVTCELYIRSFGSINTETMIYTINSCPSAYSDQDVVSKCSASLQPDDISDTSLLRPATNLKRRLTYGNVYCALCNDDLQDLMIWDIGARCGEPPAGYFDTRNGIGETTEGDVAPVTQSSYPTSEKVNPPTTEKTTIPTTVRVIPTTKKVIATSTTKPSTTTKKQGINIGFINLSGNGISWNGRRKRAALSVDYNKYRRDLDNILKNVYYDSNTKHFRSKYDGKDFICEYESLRPDNIDLYTRTCVPNLVKSCPPNTDEETARKCSSNTAIVYEKNSREAFKNKYCAKCNGTPEINLKGCKQGIRTEGSSLFSRDKGSAPPCDDPKLKSAPFCSRR